MKVESKQGFQSFIRSLNISSEYVVIKPNWVIYGKGMYSDPQTLAWLLGCFQPNQKIIVIESYTPWRGLNNNLIDADNNIGVDLGSGKTYWDFYQKQDEYFLEKTGIGCLLARYNARYLNITNEYWKHRCCPGSWIEKELKTKSFNLRFPELSSYVPKALYEIRSHSTFISLTTIKLQTQNPAIYISLSLKNLFGLIPAPCRLIPYQNNNHQNTPVAITDINKIYASLFPESVWINEGLKYIVHGYCSENERLETDTGLLFVGKDSIQVDSETCRAVQIDPKEVPYLQPLEGVW